MTTESTPIVVPIRPENLPVIWLGVIVTLPLTVALLRASDSLGAPWSVGLAACCGAFGAFGLGVLHLAYRGPRRVTLTADGVLTFPTWFGLATATLPLSEVVGAEFGSDRIVLKCRPGRRNVGWSRVLFGEPALAALRYHIGAWLDARE